MSQYAALGIGAEAWVELQELERRGIADRNNDKSGMSISWRTLKLVMTVLRAIRIEDFVAARLRGEATVRPEKDEKYASRAEYENHMPWCRARQFNGLNVAKCTCDLKSATVRVEEEMGEPEPSVPLSAIRALVQQWRERALEFDDTGSSLANVARSHLTQCADQLTALCPAPPEDQP